ncbi:hypothetical protein D3C81_2024910 [compost metagenome]
MSTDGLQLNATFIHNVKLKSDDAPVSTLIFRRDRSEHFFYALARFGFVLNGYLRCDWGDFYLTDLQVNVIVMLGLL